ncbi:MAG: ATP-binding protein [Candidatus Thiodiazotropha sp.]
MQEDHQMPFGRSAMQRFIWLPLGFSVLLVAFALTGLVAMSWRSLDRLHPVQAHMLNMGQIEEVGLSLEQTLLKALRGVTLDPAELQALKQQVVQISQMEGTLHPQTSQRLNAIVDSLQTDSPNRMQMLLNALGQLRDVLSNERSMHNSLLSDVVKSTHLEFRLAMGLMVGLPLVGGIALMLLLHRTRQPLKDLQDLLNRLGGREFKPVPEAQLNQTARLARPAFNSYNALVSRLQELEAEHLDRERLLEQRVREATTALLAQSRELSRAERLAAVGAVSAGFAHELRNPLAGIQLACSKVHQYLGEGEQGNRIAAVINELKRINHLLTQQVDMARHAPEPYVESPIAPSVNELLGLIRYQVPEGMTLSSQIGDDLICLLPIAGLRQALLNLVLNAVQIQGQEGHVTITAEHQEGQLLIQVRDAGPGFPEEMLRMGVRPFATGREGGTGLGLAMVRRFVRDHDGDLSLDNPADGGGCVSLRLPCRLPKQNHGETTNA